MIDFLCCDKFHQNLIVNILANDDDIVAFTLLHTHTHIHQLRIQSNGIFDTILPFTYIQSIYSMSQYIYDSQHILQKCKIYRFEDDDDLKEKKKKKVLFRQNDVPYFR